MQEVLPEILNAETVTKCAHRRVLMSAAQGMREDFVRQDMLYRDRRLNSGSPKTK